MKPEMLFSNDSIFVVVVAAVASLLEITLFFVQFLTRPFYCCKVYNETVYFINNGYDFFFASLVVISVMRPLYVRYVLQLWNILHKL